MNENKSKYLIEQTSFFGFKISLFTYEQLVNYIKFTLNESQPKVFFGYSIGLIAKLRNQPSIFHYSNSFDLMVSDGRILYLLAKFSGIPVKYDISIPYLTELVLKIGNENKASIMIIGSSFEKNKKATFNIKQTYKNLVVYDGIDGGNFTENEYSLIVEHINNKKPDILLIGVSSPKKEKFAFQNKEILNTKIIIPCGGMIDILSGDIKRIPKVIKKSGLGLLWRLLQEPRKLIKLYIYIQYEFFFKLLPLILLKKGKVNTYFLPKIYGINQQKER